MKKSGYLIMRLIAAAVCILMLPAFPFAMTASAKEDPMVLIREEYDGTYEDYSTEYIYNAKGQLIQKVERENQVTEYSYYADGTLYQEVQRIQDDRYFNNLLYSRTYRQDGTLEKVLRNTYDSKGILLESEATDYDPMGNPITSTWRTYTRVANTEVTTLNVCKVTTYTNTYDDQNRLTARTTMDDLTTEIIEETWWYDGEAGTTTCRKVVFENSRIRDQELWVTNSAGQMVSYVCSMLRGMPWSDTRYFLYDGNGNLLHQESSSKSIAADSATISGEIYTYTPVYRDGLLQQSVKSGSTYSCDENGTETTIVPSHTAIRCEYDREGRRISETHFRENGSQHYSIRWTYDKQGNLTRYQHSDQGTTTYTYAPLSSLNKN